MLQLKDENGVYGFHFSMTLNLLIVVYNYDLTYGLLFVCVVFTVGLF